MALNTSRVRVYTREELYNLLIRYEGAVSACERDGDESDEAYTELKTARDALLNVLVQAKVSLGVKLDTDHQR
jgi:hypothetical protein